MLSMRTRILTLTALILALGTSLLAAQTLPARPKTAPAATVIERILAGRDLLELNGDQVARLTRLAERLRNERGRPVVTRLNRVPGKSVPRITRTRTTAAEAFRQASVLLNAEQQVKANRLLDTLNR